MPTGQILGNNKLHINQSKTAICCMVSVCYYYNELRGGRLFLGGGLRVGVKAVLLMFFFYYFSFFNFMDCSKCPKNSFDYVLLQRYLYVPYSFILLNMFQHFVACLLLFDI